ncbi:UNVERIFIED_CONTAM: hypothetical protein PYX00_003504 [Menopon gallinae]|uniref:Uncharacterized protein n=1 Tax=Menopon gallinae TaxID=328185 RepID=A0AAW2I1Y4_9NEOP
MPFPTVFGVVIGLFAFAKCHQPLEDVTEISPIPSAPNIAHNCSGLRQENERLRQEVDSLKGKLEAIREIEEEDSEESDESSVTSRSKRSRRGVKCDAGTLAAWACAPQCVFKLKGLCGLSLKSICHC